MSFLLRVLEIKLSSSGRAAGALRPYCWRCTQSMDNPVRFLSIPHGGSIEPESEQSATVVKPLNLILVI